METQKVYKAMRVDEGVLKSVWAGNPKGGFKQRGVIYIEGQISYAPEGQKGLSAFGEFEDAIKFCKSNCSHGYPMVIHEATPLGAESRGHELCSEKSARTYPAILLGKEVWREPCLEQQKLEEIQKDLGGDITRCTRLGLRLPLYSIYWNQDRYTVYKGSNGVVYEGKPVDTVRFIKRDIEQDKPRPKPKFKIGDRVKVTGSQYTRKEDFTVELIHWGADNPHFGGHAHWHYGFRAVGYYDPEGYFVDEEHLELAPPKEEWVDVTKECTLNLKNISGKYYVSLYHDRYERIVLGAQAKGWNVEDGDAPNPSCDYRIEICGAEKYQRWGGVKLFKKVMK